MPDNRDELDRLVDSALATYADPGPDSGLEDRVLRRIAAEAGPAPRRRWLAWAIALPVAAGLLIFAVLAGMREYRAPSSNQLQARKVQEPSAQDSGRMAENRAMRSEGSGKHASGPKGPVKLGQSTARINPCSFKTTASSSKTTASSFRTTGCTAPTNQSRPNATSHRNRAVLAAKPAPLPKLGIFPTLRPLSAEEQALVNFAVRAAKPERESLIVAQQQADAPLRIAAIEIKPLEPPAAGANLGEFHAQDRRVFFDSFGYSACRSQGRGPGGKQ